MAIVGKSIIEFGRGDIGVFSGNIKELGILSLRSLEEPKEVGFNLKTETLSGAELLEETEVLMTFKNIESIDVVIKALQRIKTKMEDLNG